MKVLLRYNADVDAVSDSGSTPIRSACYIVRNGLNTSHFEIIKCLVRAGADVEQPNHFGGTCLINSVQSPGVRSLLLVLPLPQWLCSCCSCCSCSCCSCYCGGCCCSY